MSHLIVVGDSFCSSGIGTSMWPDRLSLNLDLDLYNYGAVGQSWWPIRQFLGLLPDKVRDNCDAIVFVHTNADRVHLHVNNPAISHISSITNDDEMATAMRLFYKHILNSDFQEWAQDQWFKELSEEWSHIKMLHLHSFPWTVSKRHLLKGMNVTTNLAALSLNEIDSDGLDLEDDNRPNHFNKFNNDELARQLTNMIKNYREGDVELDVSKFELKSTKWFNWGKE